VTPFRDLPIRRKLLVMTLSSSAAALVLATAGFLVWDIVQFHTSVQRDLAAQMRLLSDNSALAIPLRDVETATETLSVLQEQRRVAKACLYDGAGTLFARYERSDGEPCPGRLPDTAGSLLAWDELDLVLPVHSREARVGTMYVTRDLVDLHERLQVGVVLVGALLVLAIGTAWVTAARMQRSIASPLLQLADTARRVSATRDYALRATPTSRDEVGVVVHAFNDMLDRITERTDALSRTNAELAREIEERRRVEAERTAALERERDANRLKDEFLATLSHELRTPLNAVLGWTRILRAASLEPAMQARALESIERNARAQARLVEDLLEISRIVTGKLRLAVQDIDLATLVERAVEVVRPAAAAKRLRLSLHIASRPALTMGDPDRLQQIFWNLLSNAVKFTPVEGEVAVTLDTGPDGYTLCVRDTGPGIDPKFLPFVFEPFRQADASPSREHGGLGLGLAIARQLVELHGGTIRVRSEHTGGCTFEVRLPSVVADPVAIPPDTPPPMALEPLEADADLLSGSHLLVVDDEEDAREMLATVLRRYGATVTAVASAEAALQAMALRVPDVLLSDIGMPGEDGYSLIRRIRALPASHGGAIPAVAITAYASAQDQRAVRAAGYQAHLSKPVDPDDVARLVASLARAPQGRPS
jgi:signal transduction histidine kinase/CheY-like chemotaxis protein